MLVFILYLASALLVAQAPSIAAASYTLRPEDLAARARAIATNGSWHPPADMPRIYPRATDGLPPRPTDAGLTRRNDTEPRNVQYIGVYSQPFAGGSLLSQAWNESCHTGCITLSADGNSALLTHHHEPGPYPNMDTWQGPGCDGDYQYWQIRGHHVVLNTFRSGFRSYVGYWDCGKGSSSGPSDIWIPW